MKNISLKESVNIVGTSSHSNLKKMTREEKISAINDYLIDSVGYKQGSDVGQVYDQATEIVDSDFDHDCVAGPDEGCQICGMLIEKGIKADYDPY